MNPYITESRSAEHHEWNQIWSVCGYATFFHSPEWSEIIHTYTKGLVKPCPRHITFSDGKKALLVVTEKKRLGGLYKIHESSPLTSYGGWISRDQLGSSHTGLLVKYLKDNYANLIWRINPFERCFAESNSEDAEDHCRDRKKQPHHNIEGYPEITNDTRLQADQTYAVPLYEPWVDLYQKMKEIRLPRKIRRAEKHNLVIRKIHSDNLGSYMEIYEDARLRWTKKRDKGAVYSAELFDLLLSSEYCDFWGVYHRDSLICAGPVLKSSRHAVCWLTLARSEFLTMKPYEFFYYNLILHYRENNYRWFDFNPSGHRTSLERFKRNFATRKLNAPVLNTASRPLRLLQKVQTYLK